LLLSRYASTFIALSISNLDAQMRDDAIPHLSSAQKNLFDSRKAGRKAGKLAPVSWNSKALSAKYANNMPILAIFLRHPPRKYGPSGFGMFFANSPF
jgi:hypothetical protein